MTDLEYELGDFLAPDDVRQFLAAWSETGKNVAAFLGHAYTTGVSNPYERTKREALLFMSVVKDHKAGRPVAERLIELAGDDEVRLLDAKYIYGRECWYVRELGQAAEMLRDVRDLASALGSRVRQAQASVYLARIGTDFPDRLPPSMTTEQLADEAIAIAPADRTDIRLLALRPKMSMLSKRGRKQEALDLGRGLLHGEQTALEKYPHILASVRIEVGILLRSFQTEEARTEAWQLYSAEIARGGPGPHVGICHYLRADVSIDRMIESLRRAHLADVEQRTTELSTHRANALGHYKLAFSDAYSGVESLQDKGDPLAIMKGNRRWMLLNGLGLGLPDTTGEAVDTLVGRDQFIQFCFLGMPSLSAGATEKYDATTPELTVGQLEELVNSIFSSRLFPMSGTGVVPPRIRLQDYLGPDDALLLWWMVSGGALIARAFCLPKDGGSTPAPTAKTKTVGWWEFENYFTTIQPLIRSVRHRFIPKSELDIRYEELYAELLGSIRPAVSLPDAGARSFRRTLVLMPSANEEFYVPFEWASTPVRGKEKISGSLLELTRDAVVYATPWCSPHSVADVKVRSEQFRLFATTQELQAVGPTGEPQSIVIHNAVSSAFTNREIAPVDLDNSRAAFVPGEAFILVGHADSSGDLVRFLERQDYSGVRAACLLFCSSAQYTAVHGGGVFVDGLLLRLRSQLGPGAVLISSRVVVGLDEAIRFGHYLLAMASVDTSLSVVVTSYLHRASWDRYSPFESPWLIS